MELFLLYVWLKLDTISTFFGLTGFACLVYGIPYLVSLVNSSDYQDKVTYRYADEAGKKELDANHRVNQRRLKRHIFSAILGAGLLWTVGTLLPSQKQSAVLVAGHYALKIASSPEADKVLSVLRKKANEYLDAELAPKEKAK